MKHHILTLTALLALGLAVSAAVASESPGELKGVASDTLIDDSLATEAGLKVGDVIEKMGDAPITSQADLHTLLMKYQGGEKVKIAARRGEESIEVETTLTTKRRRRDFSGATGLLLRYCLESAMDYRHTQHGPLYLFIFVVAATVIVFGRAVQSAQPALNLVDATGLFIATFAFCFKRLTVEDAGDHLLVHYGPIPLFWHRVPYASITAVQRSRSKWVDGWGIHFLFGRGWTYNLWGFDCVELQRGDRLERIGTDDPDGLVRFLESKLAR